MVSPASNTVVNIRTKVRRLTNSPSESALKTSDIDSMINVFVTQNFPNDIKTDQMRSVYTFFTQPYVDRYPIDVNYTQGVRAPFYVDGIQGSFFKDREQFYNLWPRFPSPFQQGAQILTGNITGIAQPTNPTQITSPNHNLSTNSIILISGVGGMTQLNGNVYTITIVDANTFTLNGVDNTSFGAYTTGGNWTTTNTTFSFALPAPFLAQEVLIGSIDINGTPISINDDGYGNLLLQTPNPVVSVPAAPNNYTRPIPGMFNINTANPGLNRQQTIGTVNYQTGQIDFVLPVPVEPGQVLTIRVSQYQTGRPYCLLFWNNFLQIRPVPKQIHKCEIEVYLTPVQFISISDVPIVNQWWQYIAYGVAREIYRERKDMQGVQMLQEGWEYQESLVLERQAVEEIGQPNYTLFNSTTRSIGFGGGLGYY
jgi:hypothetical protein